mmetsp:Transcript_13074/g.29720  ORF Transcript_13074/g.29720 Transcript_13074/m.29720 type:complete len:668 (-) Transcript_13074:100-2103(-)
MPARVAYGNTEVTETFPDSAVTFRDAPEPRKSIGSAVAFVCMPELSLRIDNLADVHSRMLQASLQNCWHVWHESFLRDLHDTLGVAQKSEAACPASVAGDTLTPTACYASHSTVPPLHDLQVDGQSSAHGNGSSTWASNYWANNRVFCATNIFSTGSEQRARTVAEIKRAAATSEPPMMSEQPILSSCKTTITSATVTTVQQASINVQALCQTVVKSKAFDLVVGLAILINSILIGAEVEYVASHMTSNRPDFYMASQHIFVIIFSAELMLRVIAEGRGFLCGRSVLWNIFDSLILLSAVCEVFLEMVAAVEQNTVLGSFLRAMRTVRVVRIIRMWKLKAFEGLRMMVRMIISTLKSLAWSLVLMGVITYIFATTFTQGTAYYLLDREQRGHGPNDDVDRLQEHFGSLPSSAYFLFSCLLGGESWGRPVAELASKLGGAYVALFLLFMSFSFFAVFNVITSFFCENAFVKVKNDRERIIEAQVRNQAKYVSEFNHIFQSLCSHNDGEITLADLEMNMVKEDFQAYLRHLNLNVDKAWDIFRLVDADRSGSVSAEEFVEGCLRLRGEAKAIDVARLGYDMNKIEERLGSFIEFTETSLAHLVRALSHQVSGGMSPTKSMAMSCAEAEAVSTDAEQSSSQCKDEPEESGGIPNERHLDIDAAFQIPRSL